MAKRLNGFTEDNNKNQEDTNDLMDITDNPGYREKPKHSAKDIVSTIFKRNKSARKKAPFKANSKVLFAILAILCGVLIILSATFEQIGKPFKIAASKIVVPAQNGVNVIGTWISEKLDEFNTVQNLAKENEELKKQIEELRASNNTLRQQNSELDRLSSLLDLKTEYEEYDTIAVKIISKDASKWFSSFTVNKGSNDGIQKNMNVVAQGGLVGVVTDVGPDYATVRTVINDDSNISAMFEYSTDLCVVSGNLASMDDNLIDFTDASVSIEIEEGDALVTSHVSSVYLPGLLIGYISDFQTDGNGLTQSGHITPVVDFDNLSEVLIITQLKETTEE